MNEKVTPQRQIRKYYLNVGYNFTNIPKGSRFLHFNSQHGQLVMWIEENIAGDIVPKTLIVNPTGAYLTEQEKYVATALVNGGETVWHLYDLVSDGELK